MFNRFSSQRLSRAQNAVLNAVELTFENAEVIALAKTGLHRNAQGVQVCSVTVELSENPGHPIQLTGLASIATPVSLLKVSDRVSGVASIQGSLSRGRRPYGVLSELKTL